MRIALYGHDTFGVRIGRVLLAERHLDQLGVVGEDVRHPKVERIDSVDGYDVVLIDRLDRRGSELFEEALALRTDIVTLDEPPAVEHCLCAIVGDAANPRGLAHALAISTAGSAAEAVEVTIAWAREGRPRRRGQAVTFPAPIGARWAGETTVKEAGVHRALEAPGPGPWTGALSRVTTMTESGLQTTTTAVVDDGDFLAAVMVAGAAIAAAEGGYGSGFCSPADPGGSYLRAVRRAGLEAATFTQA